MPTTPQSLHVDLARAIERIVYIGDTPPSRVFRTYINEQQLHELSVPYVAVVLGQRSMQRGRHNNSLVHKCDVIVQIVAQLAEQTADRVDEWLGIMEGNLERFQMRNLPGIEAQVLYETIMMPMAYNEQRLRELGVFDSMIRASWLIETDRHA